jgi:hypothetical protein
MKKLQLLTLIAVFIIVTPVICLGAQRLPNLSKLHGQYTLSPSKYHPVKKCPESSRSNYHWELCHKCKGHGLLQLSTNNRIYECPYCLERGWISVKGADFSKQYFPEKIIENKVHVINGGYLEGEINFVDSNGTSYSRGHFDVSPIYAGGKILRTEIKWNYKGRNYNTDVPATYIGSGEFGLKMIEDSEKLLRIDFLGYPNNGLAVKIRIFDKQFKK